MLSDMVKSILVPTATAASITASSSGRESADPSTSNTSASGSSEVASASNNKVKVVPDECGSDFIASNIKVKAEPEDEGGSDFIDTDDAPTIDFHDVFSELQKYKQENNGSLSIKVSHPAISRIIDTLSESSHVGIEVLSKKRWEDQFAVLKKFQEHMGHVNVPLSHPTIGNWVRIQKEQYENFEQEIPCALTKNRYGKLKAIGFGSDGGNNITTKSDERDKNDDNNLPRNAKMKRENNDGGIKSDVFPKKNGKQAVKPKIEQLHEVDDEGKVIKIKGKCDICEKSDGFWGHNMQQCKECGVRVHELCYGMAETKCKNLDFLCHACNAVGTEAEVNVPSKIGGCGKKMGKKREMIRQEQRPTECILCSHDKGIHAMHPLLDTHGTDGRQLVIDRPCWDGKGRAKKQKRLAWVHTLCASVICSNPRTRGDLYGCDSNNNYFGEAGESSDDDEEFMEEDNGSVKEDDAEAKSASNSDEEESSEGEESCTKETTVSFAIATDEGYIKNIREHRSLKCFICGKIDKTYRFPLQCTAGDENEHGRWKVRHRSGTNCYMAMHVGCARWGCVEPEGSHLEMVDGKKCRLCWFTPGRDVADDEDSRDSYGEKKSQTVAHCYCSAHARDLVVNNPKKKMPSEVVVSSQAAKIKTEQPRRKPAMEPEREQRAQPRRRPVDRAQSSFKKSLNSIRPRGNKKKGAQKRKSETVDSSDIFFGAAGSKRVKVEFTEEYAVQYPSMGRSARSLAGSSDIPLASSVQNSNAKFAANNGQPGGVLKRGASNCSLSGQPSGKRRLSPVPDMTASSATGTVMEEGKREHGASNGSTEQVFGKRKAGPNPDLPNNGTFKRVKTEN